MEGGRETGAGVRGPLFLFLECSLESAAARKSRKTERLFFADSFLPFFFLFGAIRGGRRRRGEGGPREGTSSGRGGGVCRGDGGAGESGEESSGDQSNKQHLDVYSPRVDVL